MRVGDVLRGGLLSTLLIVSGCAEGGPAAPDPATPADLSGTWVGEVSDSYGGAGRLQLSLDQVLFSLSGTFQFEFDDPGRNRSGRVSGNLDQAPLMQRMQMASSEGFDCAPGVAVDSFLQVSWTRAGATLRGDYTGFACIGVVTGSFSLTKR